MARKIIIGVFIVIGLVVSGILVDYIRPFFIGEYGIDPIWVGIMFGVAEILFNVSILIMLWFSGVRKITLKVIMKFKIREFKVDFNNRGAVFGLLLNRISWVLPFLYLLYKGWSAFPWWVLGIIGLEIAITIGIGIGVVNLTKRRKTMKGLEIRNAEIKDLDGILNVERETWGEMGATREMLISRLRVFPEGMFVAVVDGELVGVVATQIVKYDSDHPIATWAEATDNGLIAATHDYDGDTGFGVDLSVVPRFAGEGIGETLTGTAIREVGIKFNLGQGFLGGRMPGYCEVAEEMTSEEYVNARRDDGELLDPELRFYERSGLEIVKVLPGYMPEDEASCGNGVLLLWKRESLE